VDAGGNAYIIGSTDSKDFPITQGAFQPSPGTAVAYGDNGYIVKLNAGGSALVYSSYITAAPRAIALEKNGRAYVTGQSWGRLPTTPGVVQRQNNGLSDAFVMKIGIDGTLLYSTYVGGPAIDSGFGIAVDDQGSAYVTGDTRGDELNSALTQPQFPVTPGAFQTVFNGTFQSGNGADAFVFKLSPDGSSLIYSTYLGGGGFETGIGIQVSAQGEALVVGSSESINFPTTHDAFVSITPLSPYGGNPYESFLAQLDNAGRKLQYSTYLMRSSGQLAFHSVTGVVYAVVLREDGSPEVARVDLAAEPPTPFLGGIGNAASYQGGTVAPGEMVVLLGRGIGPSPGVSASGFLGAIGTDTGGVQVFFDEIAAPVLFASSDEVHAQAPFEIAGRSNVLVNVKYGGNDSNSIQLQVIEAIPGIFTVNGRGSGQAAILNQDGTINSPANPAARGSIVSMFLTGGGVTNPPSGTGQITPLSALRSLSGGVRVSMETLAGARIMFAGTAPGFVSGLVQVNVEVPLDAPVGDSVPLFLTVGDKPQQDFQSGVTIAIR